MSTKKSKAALAKELECLRRRVRGLERTLAGRDRQEASYWQDVSRLTQAFRPARIRAWRWAVDTRLTQYLPSHADVLGSRGEPVGTAALDEERLLEAVHPDDRQQLASVWNRAYTEHTPYETEYRVVRGDGEVRHQHEIATPEFDEAGLYLGHFGTTQDITRMKRAKGAEEALARSLEDLKIARDEAEAANWAKSEFLATMSHELRTPLNAIIGFSEIIKDETFGPVGSTQYRGYASDIHGSGQHLLGLINDILDLSKVESGAEELHEKDAQIPDLTHSVLRLVRQRAEKNGIALELDLGDDLPLLRVDELKLKQILVNLLTNAVKFTDAGGKVTLKTWCRADSGFVFQVIDTGVGIAPEEIPKALSQFGQVESKRNRTQEGTGLGLPLSKSLAELHGGSLDLQSRPGAGTTVTVRLPAARIVASLDNSDSLDVEDRAAS